ncbi:MAG: phage holin family protein [Clostridia bacterium]|nr:phage holin family protein [Clostridia bacterium]
MKITLYLKAVTGALAGIVSAVFGPLDAFFYGLVFCVVADYITGICAAIYEKKLDSRVGYVGILKKVVIMTIVALAHTIGQVATIPEIRDVVIGFYIANEGISILENASKMNIKYTNKLKNWLTQLQERQ